MNSLIITVKTVDSHGIYGGHRVFFQGRLAYWRPYDGTHDDEVLEEAAAALGDLVRERLGNLPKDAPEEEDPW